MKKLYTYISAFFLMLFACITEINAQGIYQLWSGSSAGGAFGSGLLFSTRFDGTAQQVKDIFEVYAPGRLPGNHQAPVVYNNKLYGTIEMGGPNDDGIVYQYDAATNNYRQVADFYSIGLEMPKGSPTLYNNKFYGVTYEAIYEFNPGNNALVKKVNVNALFGGYTSGMLTLYNNKLYGTTDKGGAYDEGVIYEYDPATNNCVKKVDLHLGANDGSHQMTVYGNKLYGVCDEGGKNNYGVIFVYDPATATVTDVKSVDDIGARSATGRLAVYNNKLYGCTSWGGVNNDGVIFEYNPATHTLVKEADLLFSGAQNVYGSLTVYNNKLYGLAANFDIQSGGILFEYNLLTNNYSQKVTFDGDLMGGNPLGSLTLYNNKMYAFTTKGGINDFGVFFEYDPAVNGYTKKLDLGQSIGHTLTGNLSLYNNKLYGITLWGGTNNMGIIYSYDLRTQTFSVLYNMQPSTGVHVSELVRSRGLTLFNNKFYGVTQAGGLDNKGVIFEFDPATNTYTKKLDFATVSPAIGQVSARMTVFNNKLYGVAGAGGSGGNGVLYEYDPAGNVYKEKVHFSGAMGSYGVDVLTSYNNKLYGVTRNGGINSSGVIYEYNPAINGFLKLYDFETETGRVPVNSLVPFNNKLYGTTYYGATADNGVLFEYDLASKQYSVKHDFSGEHGAYPSGGLYVLNNRIYGTTVAGGNKDWGVFYEFDPLNNTMVNKIDFSGPNGKLPQSMEITKVPAPTAHGKPGVCDETNEVVVDGTNKNQWIAFTNVNGDAVAEIQPNGNILGRVVVHYFVHDGDTRKDGKGNYYLNRNISIEVQNQPTTPVNVRLYIRDTELDELMKTPGSGVLKAEDIAVFKNQDLCSAEVNSAAAKINTSVEQWGFDYVYSTQVTSFSSFYFASSGIEALPIGLTYFKGNRQGSANKLEWKAECTSGDVDFIIERSGNGLHFDSIGIVWATQESCNKPFTFIDNKALAGHNYYRLQIKEKNGDISYSKIILLGNEQNAGTSARIIPNPVVNNYATLQINASKKATLQTVIIDVTGRTLLTRQINVEEGLNSISLQVQQLRPGIYQLMYNDGEKNQVIRFVKQ